MKEVNDIKVVIDSEVYELTSHESPEHVQSVAVYIDRKIKEIYRKRGNTYMNQKMKTLFIALNIADDLFKERVKNKEKTKEVKELSESLSDFMDLNAGLSSENEILKEKVAMLERELFEAKRDLNEFLENIG